MPMLYDSSFFNAHDVDAVDRDGSAAGGNAKERPAMEAGECSVDHHSVVANRLDDV